MLRYPKLRKPHICIPQLGASIYGVYRYCKLILQTIIFIHQERKKRAQIAVNVFPTSLSYKELKRITRRGFLFFCPNTHLSKNIVSKLSALRLRVVSLFSTYINHSSGTILDHTRLLAREGDSAKKKLYFLSSFISRTTFSNGLLGAREWIASI